METLAERIQRSGKLDANEIAELGARVASWLENRHREGDVHGSLNPGAIVFPIGELGGAALLHPSEVPELPAFFSPERIATDHTSKADDVWALGCLLYFGLTGHAPFAGATKKDVRARLDQGPAAPLAVFDVCDDDLGDITESMIALAMNYRVTSATKIRDQLAVWLRRKHVRVGPMLEVLREGPTVRVSLSDVAPSPPAARSGLKPVIPLAPPSATALPRPAALPRIPPKPAPKPAPPQADLVDRLPSTADLLSRARVNVKSSMPPPLPVVGERPKSTIPPPLPAQVIQESRPKSLPPPLPQSAPPPKMPLLPIDLPVAPALPQFDLDDGPAAAVPIVPSAGPPIGGPAVSPSSRPTPIVDVAAIARQPISNRPLPNLFDDLAEPEPAAPEPKSLPPLAPLLAPDAAPPSAPPVLADPLPKRGFPVWIPVAAVAALVVVGYAVFRVTMGERTASTSEASTSAAAAGPSAVEATKPAPSASVAATPSPTPTPCATPSAAPVAVADPEQCIESLLAPGAVGEGAKPDFTFICAETDPRKVASKIRSTVIKSARGAVSDAMREWAVLGWYEYAAFASMRGRCCAAPEKIVLPDNGGVCAPLDAALNEIAAQSHAGASEADQEAALKKYREALVCTARSGAHGVYGPYDPPSGGQDTAFMKTFARTRK